MNDLHQLRQTLDRHAEALTDHEVAARPASVRRRVTVVRRRRRATAGAGLALTLLVGLGAVLGLRPGAAPVGPMALGRHAPLTMTSLGYTYRATGEVHTFTDGGALEVEAQDEPRLVGWTTDGADSVAFRLPDGRVLTSRARPFGDFVYLPPDQSGTLRVYAPGHRVALVDYDLSDAAPPGVTRDGATFRETVAGRRLLAAVIGDRGQGALTTSYVAPQGQVEVALLAENLPKGAWLHVLVDGRDRIMSRGDGTTSFDPGAGSQSAFRVGTPGTTVPVRLVVTDGVASLAPYDGDLSKVRIGVGVYDRGPSLRVAGQRFGAQLEQDGHTWEIAETRQSDGSPVRFDYASALDTPRLVGLGWHADSAMTTFRLTVDAQRVETPSFGGRGSLSSSGYWVPAGAQHVRVAFTRGGGPLGVVLYQPLS